MIRTHRTLRTAAQLISSKAIVKEHLSGESYIQNGLEGRPDLHRKVRDIVAEASPSV